MSGVEDEHAVEEFSTETADPGVCCINGREDKRDAVDTLFRGRGRVQQRPSGADAVDRHPGRVRSGRVAGSDERMPSADHSGRAEPFQPTHRFQPGFEPTVIGFDGVIRVLLHDMAHRGQQLIEYPRVGRRPISAHLCWAWAMLEGAGEELVSGR
jgi:hypothetical protein